MKRLFKVWFRTLKQKKEPCFTLKKHKIKIEMKKLNKAKDNLKGKINSKFRKNQKEKIKI